MATCRECLHFETCLNDKQQTRYYGEKEACNNVQDLCRYFLSKSDYVKRERGEWISVKDRLPERNGYYLVYMPLETKGFDDVMQLYYCGNDIWGDGRGDAPTSFYNITHWQPLPEPPNITTEDALRFVLFSDFMKGGAE